MSCRSNRSRRLWVHLPRSSSRAWPNDRSSRPARRILLAEDSTSDYLFPSLREDFRVRRRLSVKLNGMRRERERVVTLGVRVKSPQYEQRGSSAGTCARGGEDGHLVALFQRVVRRPPLMTERSQQRPMPLTLEIKPVLGIPPPDLKPAPEQAVSLAQALKLPVRRWLFGVCGRHLVPAA